MKNIIEKFDKITKTASRSLGFKVNKVEDKTPSSIIIVSTKTITKQSLNSLKKINTDALILNAEELPKSKVQLLKDFSWGINMNSLTIEKPKKILKTSLVLLCLGLRIL